MFARQRSIGLDGFGTLLLSNLVIALTGGISLLWQLRTVHQLAESTATRAESPGLVLVLGSRLRNDRPTRYFTKRLLRAHELVLDDPARHILILGGKTGRNRKTEAEVGVEFLVAQGVSECGISTEQSSRHTLENLHQARATLAELGVKTFVLITSRYHLARSTALATSLGLPHSLCAAEDRHSLSPGTVLHLLREAYYLHWFEVGKRWSHWMRNRRSLARISWRDTE